MKRFDYHYTCMERFEFDCQLLELIPKVETLSFGACEGGNLTNLHSMLTLNQLKALRLSVVEGDVNGLLRELARKGILEQLELYIVDENFVQYMQSFESLRLLVINNLYYVESPIIWPANLTTLRLYGGYSGNNLFMSAIRQLKNLECFEFHVEKLDSDYFNHVTKLSQDILNEVKDRNCRLDVLCPNYWNDDVRNFHISTLHFLELNFLLLLAEIHVCLQEIKNSKLQLSFY